MSVVGVGLNVLSSATHLLSDGPVVFFLGGLYLFFHEVDTLVLVLVSGCFPVLLCVEANFVGIF
jgi:hypothetical protein